MCCLRPISFGCYPRFAPMPFWGFRGGCGCNIGNSFGRGFGFGLGMSLGYGMSGLMFNRYC